MAFSYIVVGAGRQGTASAYDLARFGEASRVTLADCDRNQAQAAADRVNRLLRTTVADAITLDIRDEDAVRRTLKGYKQRRLKRGTLFPQSRLDASGHQCRRIVL